MKWNFTLAIMAATLGGSGFLVADDDVAAPKQVRVHLRMFAGDPCGCVEGRTPKLLASPTVTTLQGSAFSMITASRVETAQGSDGLMIGRKIEGIPGPITDGKIHLKIILSNTVSSNSFLVRRAGNVQQTTTQLLGDDIQVRPDGVHVFPDLPLGQVVRLDWKQRNSHLREWIELSVDEVK
ncbi:MAG: hypothetical protein ACKVT0_13935 [Planctomycetaceae bacterium]